MSCDADGTLLERPSLPAQMWLPVPLAAMLHLGAWLTLACWLRYRVQLTGQLTADFGLEVSATQQLVIQLAQLVAELWPFILLLLAVLTVFDGVIDWLLVVRGYGRLRLCWFLGGFVLPTLMLVFSVVTLDLVLFDLLRELH